MSTEPAVAESALPPEELAAAITKAVSRPMKITRTILVSPGMKYGRLTDLAADVQYSLPEGSPEPEAFSFFTPDGAEAYIIVVSPALKAAMIEALSGGVVLATPGDLAKITKA